jgi:outer membrane protein assembly factor BamB
MGTQKWRFQTGGQVRSPPAVTDDTVHIGSYDGNLYALSAEEGTERWRFQADDQVPTPAQVGTSPAVANGTVYIGSNYRLHALSISTGTEQ